MSADGKTGPFGAGEADGARQAAGSQPPAPPYGTEGWRPGARWTGQAPVPPDELKKRQRHRRMLGSRGAGALARFFTKQVLWFIFLVFALLIIDVFLYILIAVHEMDRNYLYGTPATVTRTASEQLALEDGVYVLGDDAAAQLDGQGAWAQLIDAGGAVVWSHGVPQASAEAAEEPATDATVGSGSADATVVSGASVGSDVTDMADGSEATDGSPADASGDAPVQDPGSSAEAPAAAAASEASSVADDDGGPVPDAYTLNDIALIAHYHTVKGQPAFIWERPDGLLLVAFPAGTYETMTITWPRETWTSLPTYIGGIIVADLLILFAAYVVYRRRTQRAVEPINDALGALSRGGRAQLDLKGDLAPIADQINETSDILEHKDRAPSARRASRSRTWWRTSTPPPSSPSASAPSTWSASTSPSSCAPSPPPTSTAAWMPPTPSTSSWTTRAPTRSSWATSGCSRAWWRTCSPTPACTTPTAAPSR